MFVTDPLLYSVVYNRTVVYILLLSDSFEKLKEGLVLCSICVDFLFKTNKPFISLFLTCVYGCWYRIDRVYNLLECEA